MSDRPQYSWEADAKGSFAVAIAEIGRRVKAGEEPLPTTGYFQRGQPCLCLRCRLRSIDTSRTADPTR